MAPMRLSAGSASPGYRRDGSVGRRRACLVLTSCWALTGTALTLWVFRAWTHPVPAFNPNDGPIGPDSNLDFWLGGYAMAVPLGGLSAALAATGLWYLDSVGPTRRTWAAFASAVTAAVAVEAVFISTFILAGSWLGMTLGRVNWGLLALSAVFAVVGGATVAIVTTAPRRARSQAAEG